MNLNPNKCGCFGLPDNLSLSIGDNIIEPVSQYKYLGVPFDHRGIAFPTFCKSLVKKASGTFYPVVSMSIARGWQCRWRLNMYKSYIRSKMEYCGGLLYLWLVANSISSTNTASIPKVVMDLFNVNDKAIAWICGLKPTAKPRGSGGIYVLQSISGIVPFFFRLEELAVLFKHHLDSSRSDNPIRFFNSPNIYPPPWHTNLLAPRLASIPLWKQWLRWKQIKLAEISSLSANNFRKGPLPAPPTPKLFLKMTRQSRLDGMGKYSLASKIRDPARVRIGSYDSSLRIEDKELRYACLRWRRGVWGACNGIVCPGCHLPFRPSHASKCNLLPPTAGNINSSDIAAMKSQWEKDGISKDIRNGAGAVEAAFEAKDWDSLRLIFNMLSNTLNIDWSGDGFKEDSSSDSID